MPSPVLPAQIKAAVADPSSALCANFKDTLLKLPVLLSQLFSWMLTDTGALSVAFLSEIQEPGTYIFMAALTTRTDLVLCDGTEKTITDYQALYNKIGSTYGVASDITKFKVPDFRDKFPRGVASGSTTIIAQVGGSDTVVMLPANLVGHTHPLKTERARNDTGTVDPAGTYALNIQTGTTATMTTDSAPTHGSAGDTPDPMTVLNPFLGVYIYIKT